MHLNLNSEKVIWPDMHYVYVEKQGEFSEICPQTWKEFHSLEPKYKGQLSMIGCCSLYKVNPDWIYRAGYFLQSKPESQLTDLKYEFVPGGNYLKFTYKGTYEHLPEVSAQVFQKIQSDKIKISSRFFIENYVTNPQEVPPNENITEILVPVE